MGFTEVSSLDADVTIALGGKNKKTGKSNPKSIEGYYLGTRKVESKKGKNGLASLHFIQTSEGNVGVWGKTDLDRKLASVTPGTMIRATHTGMQATPNGEMYKYKVEVDSDNTIDVAGLQVSEDSGDEGYEESEDKEDDADNFESSEDTEDEEESVPLVASKQKQDRKALVQSLLKGKNKN